MYQYQGVDVDDFSGGETDNYLKASPARSQFLENFVLSDTKKPVTRPGTRIDDADNTPQIPIGSQRIGRLMSFSGTLFNQSLNQISYRNPTDYEELEGPAGGHAFADSDELTDYAHTKWGQILTMTSGAFDKPIKIYKDDVDIFQLRTAGLPALASAPTVTPGVGANSYVYGFCHKYTYNVGDQTFIDFGPVTLVESSSAAAPNITPIAITAIPVLANGAGDNYDITDIKIAISRSINGGGTLYNFAEVTNGTTTYNDTTSDTVLQTNDPIYTTGDVPDNDPPPRAKFCHTVGGITYYGHIKIDSDIFPSTFRQSQADDPDSVPEAFETVLEDEIAGISSIYGKPIFGCKNFIYVIEGAFDEIGRGAPFANRISDSAGCVSHSSFVQTEQGLFWAGNDGFYYSDGNKVFKISTHLNARYKERLASFRERTYRIQGKYDPLSELIYWTFSRTTQGTGEEECDTIWVCDLKYGISKEMCMYTWLGQDSFLPSAIEMHDKELYRGDHFGYVLQFSADYVTDDRVDPDTDADEWLQETIMWRYRSSAQNFGTSNARKIANKILISAKNETNVSVKITALNDDSKIIRTLEPIRWRRNFTWGDEEFTWGDPTFAWFTGGLIEQDRRFPARNLRFNYLQIQFENDLSNIVNSNGLGTSTVNGTTKVVTLDDGVDVDWPLQSVDYVLYFDFDDYVQGFPILERTADTVTVYDPGGLLQTGTFEWQLKGYKKGEIFNLNEYSISWALTSRSHDMFNRSDRSFVTGE